MKEELIRMFQRLDNERIRLVYVFVLELLRGE